MPKAAGKSPVKPILIHSDLQLLHSYRIYQASLRVHPSFLLAGAGKPPTPSTAA